MVCHPKPAQTFLQFFKTSGPYPLRFVRHVQYLPAFRSNCASLEWGPHYNPSQMWNLRDARLASSPAATLPGLKIMGVITPAKQRLVLLWDNFKYKHQLSGLFVVLVNGKSVFSAMVFKGDCKQRFSDDRSVQWVIEILLGTLRIFWRKKTASVDTKIYETGEWFHSACACERLLWGVNYVIWCVSCTRSRNSCHNISRL